MHSLTDGLLNYDVEQSESGHSNLNELNVLIQHNWNDFNVGNPATRSLKDLDLPPMVIAHQLSSWSMVAEIESAQSLIGCLCTEYTVTIVPAAVPWPNLYVSIVHIPSLNPLCIFCTIFALESELYDSSDQIWRRSRIVPIIFLFSLQITWCESLNSDCFFCKYLHQAWSSVTSRSTLSRCNPSITSLGAVHSG